MSPDYEQEYLISNQITIKCLFNFLSWFSISENMPLIKQAVIFAIKCHKNQKRISGGSYVKHPIEVCLGLIFAGIKDENILVAALLHDTIEENSATIEKIRQEFNLEIANIVDLVTMRHDEKLLEYYYRIQQDERAVLIKAFDNRNNLKTMLGFFSNDKLRKNFKKTRDFVLPMISSEFIISVNSIIYKEILQKIKKDIEIRLKEIKFYLIALEKAEKEIFPKNEVHSMPDLPSCIVPKFIKMLSP